MVFLVVLYVSIYEMCVYVEFKYPILAGEITGTDTVSSFFYFVFFGIAAAHLVAGVNWLVSWC